jgi:transcriptional regulator with XRE-family HTH domain
MNKIDKDMQLNDKTVRKEMGFRFLLFRKAIQKTGKQLASELNIPESTINEIENGSTYPKITWLHYLYEKYELNINWLLTQNGRMFTKESRPGKKDSPEQKYAELIELMQVPAVEQAINATLTKIRALLKLEKQNEDDENRK